MPCVSVSTLPVRFYSMIPYGSLTMDLATGEVKVTITHLICRSAPHLPLHLLCSTLTWAGIVRHYYWMDAYLCICLGWLCRCPSSITASVSGDLKPLCTMPFIYMDILLKFKWNCSHWPSLSFFTGPIKYFIHTKRFVEKWQHSKTLIFGEQT